MEQLAPNAEKILKKQPQDSEDVLLNLGQDIQVDVQNNREQGKRKRKGNDNHRDETLEVSFTESVADRIKRRRANK